jgi:D-alanyl-D-alanine dipeptidase
MTSGRLVHDKIVRYLTLIFASLAVACVSSGAPAVVSPPINTDELAVASDEVADSMLVDIRSVNSAIVVEMRYATANNFTGARLTGYEANRAYLRREAAAALARVAAAARSEGYLLHVYDAYRPVRATLAMVDWTERTGQQHLLRDGYIASRSRHNLGLAIDLTLAGAATGLVLDMGTPFDTFSSDAHTANASGRALDNRRALRRLMEREGFANYPQEWWHYSYAVPNPVRFDRVVR